jgi:hypothetical protein
VTADLPDRDLLDLPVLKRLRPRLDSFEIGIDAVGPSRIVGLLRRRFLAPRLFFVAPLLALALALSLLL